MYCTDLQNICPWKFVVFIRAVCCKESKKIPITSPLSEITASLQPWLNPGSMLRILNPLNGGVKSSFRRFSAKFKMASFSAILVSSDRQVLKPYKHWLSSLIKGLLGWSLNNLGVYCDQYKFYLMFLAREFEIRPCQSYIKTHIYENGLWIKILNRLYEANTQQIWKLR